MPDVEEGPRGAGQEGRRARAPRRRGRTVVHVGDEEDARANRSVGLTSRRDSHVDVSGSKLGFRFRTWAGTVLAAGALNARGAVCRKCYVHPVVIDAYVQGSLAECLDALIERLRGGDDARARRGAATNVRSSAHAGGRAGRM